MNSLHCFLQEQNTKLQLKMENFATIGETQFAHLVEDKTKTQYDNTTCLTQCAINTSLHNVSEHNVYEMIPKREYGLLLKQLEEWGVAYPKAVCKKHGVRTVQRAVAYVNGTPNVKNKGAYFTFMVRQLKKVDAEQQPAPKQEIKPVTECNQLEQVINKGTNCTPIEENPAVRENRTTEKTEVSLEATTTPVNKSFDKKGKTIPPTITKWQEAREFVAKIDEYDLTNSNILEFYKKIKKQYNFA
jgi:hypothetical protein